MEIRTILDYFKSDEYKEATKNKLITQILEFLRHKYPNSIINFNNDIFTVSGEDIEEITTDILSFQEYGNNK